MSGEEPAPEKIYYVYTLARPDGTVFYVGKGSLRKAGRRYIDRIDEHEKQAMLPWSKIKGWGRNVEKYRVIQEIWAQGGEVVKQKVFETTVERDAYLYERHLILEVYGIENLTNKPYGIRENPEMAARYRPDMAFNDANDLEDSEQQPGEMISADEAGKILGVSRHTVVKMAKRGELAGHREGFAWRFNRSDVRRYLRAHRYRPDKQRDN